MLVIRLQALGDVVVTLPFARALRQRFPGSELDFLTRVEVAEAVKAVSFLDRVYVLGGGRSERRQLAVSGGLILRLLRRRYDVVVDLQNTRLSRWLRGWLRVGAWSAFDRVSPLSAGERTWRTIEAAGLGLGEVRPGFPLKDPERGVDKLRREGWAPGEELVVLNPAGAFPSRHWPVAHYAGFARLWRARRPARFLLMGLPGVRARSDALKRAIGEHAIDLVGRTDVAEALALIRRARLVVSEDSGLMHMAWVSGVPTIALFGSSRSDWGRPLGHGVCLDSRDLPCGTCLAAECRYGDVHCLTRYSPERVAEEAETLLARAATQDAVLCG